MSKITSKCVASAQLDVFIAGKPIILWDSELRGFGVRLSPANSRYPDGKISYLVQKRTGGRGTKEVRLTFEAPDTATARDKALLLISQIRNGEDPSKRKKDLLSQRRLEYREFKTKKFIDIFEQYRKIKSDGSYYWERSIIYNKNNHLAPAFGGSGLSQITKDDIRSMLKAIPSKSVAKVIEAQLKPFFKWCVQEDLLAHNPMIDLAPLPTVKSRDRVLSKTELIAFWKATEDIIKTDKPLFGYVYRLLLLTGQRLREIAHMESAELNFAEQIFTLSAARAKNDLAHIVHLSPLAITLIEAAPRKGNRYVFSYNGHKPLSGFSASKRLLDKYMQHYLDEPLRSFQLRDLRRTFATTCAELGIDHNIADRILNHVSDAQQGVKGIYQRFEFLAERKAAMLKWNDFVATCQSD